MSAGKHAPRSTVNAAHRRAQARADRRANPPRPKTGARYNRTAIGYLQQHCTGRYAPWHYERLAADAAKDAADAATAETIAA